MSTNPDLTAAEWVKSSYSDANGGDCVEFSRTFTWIKSSYSDANGGQCLEFSRSLAWVKSTRSGGDGGQCLEFAPTAAQVHGVVPVRDSKDPDGPALTFPAGNWTTFVQALKGREFGAI
ncbi:DUF397 domain-containing protein [Streptomyces catenulae]|uniref:DUF397 domain-containing protein n=1 Tax=Streptomyces catenulae TaxID=66875 RepID=A0ABV2Z6U8_9ACTN|nr:DUF397 domain-containing protein [Streptomyces catenulae]